MAAAIASAAAPNAPTATLSTSAADDELRHVAEMAWAVAVGIHGPEDGFFCFLPCLVGQICRRDAGERVPGRREVREVEAERFRVNSRLDPGGIELSKEF